MVLLVKDLLVEQAQELLVAEAVVLLTQVLLVDQVQDNLVVEMELHLI
jgi:hypothetical protein